MYDINTKSGMAAAKAWAANLLASLSDNGTWVVPRSGSFANGLFPEPSVSRVLRELGYTVKENQ